MIESELSRECESSVKRRDDAVICAYQKSNVDVPPGHDKQKWPAAEALERDSMRIYQK